METNKEKWMFAISLMFSLNVFSANEVVRVGQVADAVSLTGNVDYMITDETPFAMTGSVDIVNTEHAVVIIEDIRPSKFIADWLDHIFVKGERAAEGVNCQVKMFANGAIVLPYGKEIRPLTCYTEPDYGGQVCSDYTEGHSGGFMKTLTEANLNNKIRSFKLKRGTVAVDMVSLFPIDTYKGRKNGLRRDIAETIAALKPAFVRFPGGCLAHGDGLDNIYQWKNTIGPVEQRKGDKNIWNYHQSMGLGYFEYFQFCEDIGAKPLPVIAAGVSCQNSARRRGDGQECVPMEDMLQYIQDILDLVEYCNGPSTSEWGSKRAAAGHPEPFNLEYIGIGNEDHITPEFEARFKMIYEAVKDKYPEITVVGTAGPGEAGKDYEEGWKIARKLGVPVVDEHYYKGWGWFLENLHRYDSYPRGGSKVYLGEYASWGSALENALAEAVYMTSLERNGDVVEFASYAPLLARVGHTQWNPDLIYFDGKQVYPSVNYHVQKLFSLNRGDTYHADVVTEDGGKSMLYPSCVRDSHTGDIIVKLVNMDGRERKANIDLNPFKRIRTEAALTVLAGDAKAKNEPGKPASVIPAESRIKVKKSFGYTMPAHSLSVIRIKTK